MKKITIIALIIISISVFTACTDKKKTDTKPETEITTKENKKAVKDKIDEAERRKQDSIRQVKEHGHAH